MRTPFQVEIVSQLEQQLGREQSRLEAMKAHLHPPSNAGQQLADQEAATATATLNNNNNNRSSDQLKRELSKCSSLSLLSSHQESMDGSSGLSLGGHSAEKLSRIPKEVCITKSTFILHMRMYIILKHFNFFQLKQNLHGYSL